MSLEIDVGKQLGALRIEARLKTGGGLTALFGHSGSGKTSILNMVAGLLQPDQGRIVLDGTVLVDTQKRVAVRAHRRRIGYVFQEARLFPHLSVRKNLLFGARFVPRNARAVSLEPIVAMLGIGALLERYPQALSGGEKQRVAIGRALLCAPRLLLMDEPLAALDEERKQEILPYIERLRDEADVPILYVSHAIGEVMRLATSVALVREGRVETVGVPEDVLSGSAHDASIPEASVLIEARVVRQDRDYELTVLACLAGDLYVPHVALPNGTRVRLRILARDVMVGLEEPRALSALNVLRGTIVSLVSQTAGRVDVGIDCAGTRIRARLTRKSVETLDLHEGVAVYAVLKSVAFDETMVVSAPRVDAHAPTS